MALVMATKMVAPNFWGWLADRSGQRLFLIRLGSVMAALWFAVMLGAQGFAAFAILLVLFGAFWNAVLPQLEVVTLLALKDERHRYSRIRLWGSIGFLVAVNTLGILFECQSIAWLGVILTVLLCLVTLNSLFLPSPYAAPRYADFRSFMARLREPDVWRFFLLVMFLQMSFGPYYTFFTIYLEGLGYSRIAISLLWSLGVVAEIILFSAMHRLLRRHALRDLLALALLLAAVRWIGTGTLAASVWALVVLQCLHAASFGIVHAAAIEFIHGVFRDGHGGQGQAFYGAASFGLGGGLGAWMAGLLLTYNGPEVTFTAAAAAALAALLVSQSAVARSSRRWGRSATD